MLPFVHVKKKVVGVIVQRGGLSRAPLIEVHGSGLPEVIRALFPLGSMISYGLSQISFLKPQAAGIEGAGCYNDVLFKQCRCLMA